MSQDNDAPFEKLDLESLFNARQWFMDAVEAKGAKVTGAGIGTKGTLGMADIDVEIDGYTFNLEITPRVRPLPPPPPDGAKP